MEAIRESLATSYRSRHRQAQSTDSICLLFFFFFFFFFDFLTQELYNREAIRTSNRISNPGCYATNSQILIAPLIPHLAGQPTVFGVSGYSGGGTKSGNTPKITPESLEGGIRPYSLTDHIHEREAGNHLSSLVPEGQEKIKVAFVPVVAPWFQGIISTVSIPLKQEMSAADVKKLYQERYGGEKLIRILGKGVPEIKDISGKHGILLGGFQVHSEGKRVVLVVSLLDE